MQALVFVGDAMEEEIDDLCAAAGELGLLGVPVFMFQEGGDAIAENAYREIARLSHGAYCRFDTGAAHELGELLRAVAAYAAGGMQGARRVVARRRSAARTAVAGAVEIAMPALIFGVLVLVLALWALNVISKVDPKIAARVLKGRRRPACRSALRSFSVCAAKSASPFRSAPLGSGCSAGCRSGLRAFRSAHAEERRADLARALGLFRDGARPRQRRDARTHHRRPSPGRGARTARRQDAGGLLGEIDEESRALLVAYLDRRDPGWSEHAQGTRQRGGARRPAEK